MPCHLQTPIGDVERACAIGAAAVLRLDEFFQHIEVGRFDAPAESVAKTAREFSDLGDDPLQ